MRHTSIEPLEPRIAPATITIADKTATWTDHDGDIVTMKWTSTDAPAFTKNDRGDGLMVSRILLDPAKHTGASFTVTVKAAGTFGDGRVELGHLDATGVALGKWAGPKAAISEVDFGVPSSVGAASFISGSIGQTKSSDTMFTGAMGNGESRIKGTVGTLKIIGDIGYGGLFMDGVIAGKHGTIAVTGSLRGDLASGGVFDGYLGIIGDGKSLSIGGSILNARLAQQSSAGFGSVTIGGDIVSSGSVSSATVNAKTFVVKGSIIGADVRELTAGSSVFIGGSVVAEDGQQDSGVISVGNAKSVTIKGSLHGARFSSWTVDYDGSFSAGAVNVFGNLGTLTIGGSIHGGIITNTNPAVNGGIYATGNIGTIKIGGGIHGYDNDPVFILAGGTSPATPGNFNAIGKLSIKGDATHAYIAAGTKLMFPGGDFALPLQFTNSNPDAGIGSVFVGGNFNTSNVFAGVKDGGSLGVTPNAAGETLAVGDAARTAKLGTVIIKGHLLSDRASVNFSGFTADVIASITVAGRKVFTAGDGLRNFDDYITAKEL